MKMAEKTILIADDDMGMRELLAYLIKKILPDISIIQARNGKETADKLEELSQADSLPDTVLTDFDMPVMNGLELLKFIRNHSDPRIKNLRVVMLTGSATRRLQIATEELNCRLLEKPMRLEDLRAIISSELTKK